MKAVRLVSMSLPSITAQCHIHRSSRCRLQYSGRVPNFHPSSTPPRRIATPEGSLYNFRDVFIKPRSLSLSSAQNLRVRRYIAHFFTPAVAALHSWCSLLLVGAGAVQLAVLMGLSAITMFSCNGHHTLMYSHSTKKTTCLDSHGFAGALRLFTDRML